MSRPIHLFLLVAITILSASLAAAPAAGACDAALTSGGLPEDSVLFELIGQVKNAPGAPGMPATSVQYGYLSRICGLTDEQTFAPGGLQNETTAYFTFYNDSTTLRVTPHGRFLIISRDGTMTIYRNDVPGGDLTTPDPDSFRSGVPIQVSSWNHQVILDPSTGSFFVTFSNTIKSSSLFNVDGRQVRLGKAGDQFRISLVGGPDPAGLVNGKFAGTAVATKRAGS